MKKNVDYSAKLITLTEFLATVGVRFFLSCRLHAVSVRARLHQNEWIRSKQKEKPRHSLKLSHEITSGMNVH